MSVLRQGVVVALWLALAACGGGNDFPENPDPGTNQQPSDTGTGVTPEPGEPVPAPTPVPGDTQAPQVDLILPADGSSASGVIQLLADASDNNAVAGVQFLVDNRNLGPEDTARPYTLQFDTTYLSDGEHRFGARARDASDNRATSTNTVTVSNPGCKTASPAMTAWQNTPFDAQAGGFAIEFDATPYGATMDAIVGVSDGAANSFTEVAAIVRFNDNGTIDARNGDSYSAANAIPYAASSTYRIRLEVNVPAHTYSAFVNGQTLAENFAFRSESQGVGSLDRWTVGSANGALRACIIGIAPFSPPPPPADSAPTAAMQATPTSGTAPLTVTFTSNGSGDDRGIVAYEWNFGDGSTVVRTADASIVYTYNAAGNYTATLVVWDTANQPSNTASTAIAVASADAPPQAALQSDRTSGPAPLLVNFDASGSTDDHGIVAYEWNFGEGTTVVGGPTASYEYANPGTYTAMVVVRDAASQASSAQLVIVVDGAVSGGGDSGENAVAVGEGASRFRLAQLAPAPNAVCEPPLVFARGCEASVVATAGEVPRLIFAHSALTDPQV